MYGEAGLCGGLFRGKLSVGSAVTHKRFGVGTITGLSGKVIEAQFSGLDHPSTLVWRDCVKTGLLSFKRLRMLPSTTSWSHCSVKRR